MEPRGTVSLNTNHEVGLEHEFEKVIGARLREQRERLGISQREVARRTGCSPSLISQIENGLSRPSVSTLYSLVTELGLSLDEAFGAVEHRAMATIDHQRVVHPDDRAVLTLESRVRWERLTATSEEGLDFLYVVYEVGGASGDGDTLMRHSGREHGLVTSGRLEVQVGFDHHSLGPGDSISYDSTTPHRLWNEGSEPAHGIWVVIGR